VIKTFLYFRAFGDSELKQFVISTPEIRRVDLIKNPLRYIILATDGFWDVVSNHEAILEVNYLLRNEEWKIKQNLRKFFPE
jgi:serine/threonine protein phosphatase PrpC